MTEETKECPICIKEISKKEKLFSCPNCKDTCCTECFLQYSSDKKNVICMHCNKSIDIIYLLKYFTDSLKEDYNKFNEIRKKIYLLEEERYLEKDYNKHQIDQKIEKLILILDELKLKKNNSEHLKKLYIKNIKKIVKTNPQCKEIDTYNIKINKLNEEIDNYNNNIEKINKEIILCKRESNKSIIIPKCEHHDCDGILNNDGFCNTCKKETCNKCKKPKSEKHECKRDDIESVKYIENNPDIKFCPKCGQSIQKSEGCNDMICTRCFARFNFKDGTEIDPNSRNFHNNHETNARRNHRRNLLDVFCGGEGQYLKVLDKLMDNQHKELEFLISIVIDLNKDNNYLSEIIKNINNFDNNYLKDFINLFHEIHIFKGFLSFVKQWEDKMFNILQRENNGYFLNRTVRQKYLEGKINKSSFNDQCFKNYNKYLFSQNIFELECFMFRTLGDLIRNFNIKKNLEYLKYTFDSTNYKKTYNELKNCNFQLKQIMILYNEEFKLLGKIFKFNKFNYPNYFLETNLNNYYSFIDNKIYKFNLNYADNDEISNENLFRIKFKIQELSYSIKNINIKTHQDDKKIVFYKKNNINNIIQYIENNNENNKNYIYLDFNINIKEINNKLFTTKYNYNINSEFITFQN